MSTMTITPATEKQVAFYAKMAVEVAKKLDTHGSITKDGEIEISNNAIIWAQQQDRKALSGHIDALIALSKKTKGGSTAELAEGYYLMDEQVFHVVKSKQGHPYAKKLVASGSSTKGSWTYAAGAASQLKTSGIAPMSLEDAKAYGKQTGTCIRCGALLTDPTSVANGIGPVCQTWWK